MVMAYVVMAYIVMACIVMAYVVTAYIVMAYIGDLESALGNANQLLLELHMVLCHLPVTDLFGSLSPASH